MSFNGTEQQTDALSTLSANLQAYGFTPQQLNGPGGLISWAWGELVGNVDPTQIAIDLQSTPAFKEVFPGFQGANEKLVSSGLPALSVSQYQQYQQTAMGMAQAAGLPPGFINKDDIGTLVGNNVSTSELSARLNSATALAYQSTPEQQQMFNQYFGTQYSNDGITGEPGLGLQPTGHGPLTPGQIAAIALDPNKAEPLIQQQILAAQVGGAGVTAGVGAISQPEATKIAQANPNLTQAQIQSAVGQVAPLAPLERALPGMGKEAGQGTLTADQLVGTQLLPTTGNLRQLQVAEEVRKAPFSGGGGYASTLKGVAIGSANSTGVPGSGT